VQGFLDGTMTEKGTRPSVSGCVDIEAVTDAHIVAAEKKEASGRYLVTSEDSYSHLELAQMLSKSGEFSKYPIPTKQQGTSGFRYKFSNEKAKKELGIEFPPIEKSIVHMAKALIQLGIVKNITN